MRKLKQLSAWVKADIKTAFASIAQAQGNTESELLKLIVEVFLKKNPPTDVAALPLTDKERKTDKVSVRFTPTEGEAITALAKNRGMKRSSYLAAIFRTHLTKRPYFPETELLALREANQELAAIGRNINQIAKVLNASLDKNDIAKAIELEAMKKLIDNHREYVKSFIRSNIESWGVSYDDR